MPESQPDETLLVIRCPSCGQRFKVGEKLNGRTVECGACEHRFRISDEVIVRGKKFYPGEKRDERLHHFQRVPMARSAPLVGVEAVRYAEPPDPAVYEPASPQRIIAGLAGVVWMALIALLLMFGARSGGALDGMVTANRMVMAGFAGLLGTGLLFYANPRARLKAVTIGLVFSAALVSLPLFFTTGSQPLAAAPKAPDLFAELTSEGEEPADEDVSPETAELRQRIGTEPLEEEIARLEAAGSERRAVGLWLRDMRERNRFLIREYILRSTGADPQSHFFPRDSGDYLLVITGIKMSIDEVARLAAPLGTVERVYGDLSVIEVKVDNQNFVEGPLEKLSDRDDPAFYDLNKRELESIDMGRVERAVKRLAEAEPKVYRSDITRRLLILLGMSEVAFKGDVCRALEVWSSGPGPAGEGALREANRLLSGEQEVPPEMVTLCIKEKTPGVAGLVHQLWEQNPNRWENHYRQLGPEAESALLRRFPTAEGMHRDSAVRLLGRVGGEASLPVLEAELNTTNPGLRVLLEKSLNSIRERLGE